VTCLTIAAVTSVCATAGAEPLDARTAVALAVRGNVDLARERVEIQISRANLLSAQGRFDVVLEGDAAFSQQITPAVSANDIASGVSNTFSLNLGVSRQLETGGNLRFGTNARANETTSRFSCGTLTETECLIYSTNFNLNFNHPLLRGFGRDVAMAEVRRARVQSNLALLNRQARASTIVRDVLTAYWELAYATEDLAIRRAAVELSRKQLAATRAGIEVGRLAPIDAAAVERAISDRLQDVARAEQNELFRSLTLRRLFGLPVEAKLEIYRAAERPQGEPLRTDVTLFMSRALEANPQLKALRMGRELTAIDIQVADNLLRPQLDLFTQVGTTGRDRDLGRTLNQAVNFDNFVWQTGLSFQLPVQNRVARGRAQSARLQDEGVILDVRGFELEVRDSVVRLASGVETAGRRVELARETVRWAEKNLEAEQARFDVGRSTNNDVVLRQQELEDARIQVARATVDMLVSELSLDAVTGDILGRYDIVLSQ
jgi:outer membrane protein TolC